MRRIRISMLIALALCGSIGVRAQEVPLTLIGSTDLPSGTTVWDAAPLPYGGIAAAVGGTTWSDYRVIGVGSWTPISGSTQLRCLFVDSSDGLWVMYKNVAASQIECMSLPEGQVDTVARWPNGTTYGSDGSYNSWTSIIGRVLAYPCPPAPSTEFLVEGHTSFFYYNPHNGSSSGSWNQIDRVRPGMTTGTYSIPSFPLQYAYIHGATNIQMATVWWRHGNDVGWVYRVGLVQLIGDARDTTLYFTGVADYPVVGPTSIQDKGICIAINGTHTVTVTLATLAGGQADSVYAVMPGHTGYLWAKPGLYTNCFACDAVSSCPGDEIFCLLPDERRFDVRSSSNGDLIATTSSFAGDHNDIKFIGVGSPQRAVAVRDSNTIRIYAIGEVEATDPRRPDRVNAEAIALSTYPEPAHDQMSLTFSKPIVNGGEIVVYDLLGREAARVRIQPNASSVNIHVSELPAGIYFARLTAPTHTVTKKFVVLK